MTTGKIIVLVAPSGAGKTTLARRLFDDFPTLRFSVSATTRAPREGEQHGKDYYFLSLPEFIGRIEQDEFIEWEEFYGGNRYGTLKSEIENKIKEGYFILLDIEVKGALNVQRMFREQVRSFFIMPPSLDVLKQRLVDRSTESEESLSLRLERAEKELTYADHFDHIIVNNHLEQAYAELKTAVHDFLNQD
ncbi:MAG: guanylate kinase [Bacteroidota bacterium]